MNVCFLSTHYYPTIGGNIVQIENFIKGFKKNKINSIVVTKSYRNEPEYRIIDGSKVYRIDLNKLKNIIYLFKFIKILIKNKIKIIYYFSPCLSFNLLCLIAKILLGCKIIFTATGYLSENQKKIVKLQTFLISDKIIFVSDYIGKKFGFYSKNKCYTIYNGIDRSFIFKNRKRRNIILTVSRIEKVKDIETLVKSIPIVLKKYPKIQFLLVSDIHENIDYYKKDIEPLIIKYKLNKKIKIISRISKEELINYYNTSKILVHPSFHETFGLIFIEAMACGLPVITTNVTAMPEIINDAGILIEPQNPKALGDNIIKLLTDKKLYRELQKKGLERSKIFALDRMLDSYMKIYKEALE